MLKGRRESRISSASEPEISDSDSPSPSTSRESEEFTTNGGKLPEKSAREPPTVVISETDCVPQVSCSIDEEENSSNEVIAASKETVTGFAGRVEANTTPLPTNPGQHDLLTLSMDSNLGKSSQMEVPSFLGLSQKSNLIGSPYDNIISAPVVAEAMYVTETLTGGERREVTRKRPEVSDTAIQRNGSDPSDPKVPFTFTLSSSDSNATGTSSKDPSGAPPNEERMAKRTEENVPHEVSEADQVDSIVVSDNDADSCQGSGPGTESEATQTETFTTSFNGITESCDDHEPIINNISSPDTHKAQIPVTGGGQSSGDVAYTPQYFEHEALQSHRSKAIDSSQAKAVSASAVLNLFDPPRKQIPQPAECTQLYTCGMLDTPVISARSQAHETISSTSLASASTESIHCESEFMDANTGASDKRSTILKCITDNSFLEFLITEGLDMDARSKQGVVEVVMAQYSDKLNRVENTIPKLAAQIRDTETTIGQQREKVKQLQKELESLKGDIVKNESLLQRFMNEQQELSEHRKALKRKVARCEGTMKNVRGGAKKVRLQ